MATKLVEKGNSLFEVSTSVTGEAWKKAQDKALKKLVSQVKIDGFRKGEAPLGLAKQRINPSELINEAINLSLNDAYVEVLTEHKLNPFTNPEVEITKVDENGYEVKFAITTFPTVKLGQYKGIKVALEKVKVSAKEVDEAIKNALESNSNLVLKEGAAEMGDTVVFDFKGYIDGKEFDGGSADNYSLVLGSKQFIPGFEEQLVGVTSESKKDVLVTFPEQYVKDLAGKDAKFVCMIHEIKTKQAPEFNDEFVQGLNIEGCENVEDYKTYQKGLLTNEKEQQAKQKQFIEILDTICNNAEISIADKVLEKEAEAMKQNMIGQIEQNGLTYEQYKEITGMDDAKIAEEFKKQAKVNLTQVSVLNEIGRVENLVITRADVDAFYENIAKQYGMEVEKIKEIYKNNENQVIENLFHSKIQNFIIANNGDVEEAKEEKAEKAEKKPAAKKTTAAKKPAAKKTTTKKTTKKEEKVEEAK